MRARSEEGGVRRALVGDGGRDGLARVRLQRRPEQPIRQFRDAGEFLEGPLRNDSDVRSFRFDPLGISLRVCRDRESA